MSRAGFAYAQARLHARLQARLSGPDWRVLAGSRTYGNCLDVIHQTTAAHIATRLDRSNSVHHMERVLREAWRAEVFEIAGWVPFSWQPATRWMALLPYLRRFEATDPRDTAHRWLRLAVEFGDDAHVMLKAGAGRKVSDIWREEWARRFPDKRQSLAATRALAPLFARTLDHGTTTPPVPEGALLELGEHLKRQFRRHPQAPLAVFAFLGLAALDFDRLRGIFADRITFATPYKAEVT